jgi:hypothetical protein
VTATYNDTLPTAKDRVRFNLGDTNVSPATNALLTDETIGALITQHGETMGTVVAAESLATRFGQEPDSVSLSGKTVTWKDRVKAWWELAARLRKALGEEAVEASNTSGTTSTLRPGEDERSGEYYREEWVGWPG